MINFISGNVVILASDFSLILEEVTFIHSNVDKGNNDDHSLPYPLALPFGLPTLPTLLPPLLLSFPLTTWFSQLPPHLLPFFFLLSRSPDSPPSFFLSPLSRLLLFSLSLLCFLLPSLSLPPSCSSFFLQEH